MTNQKEKPEAEYGLFWIITERGKIIINVLKYKKYLEKLGIFRYYIDSDKNKGFIYILRKGRFIDQIPVDAIKIIVQKDLLARQCIKICDHLMDNNRFFENGVLTMLNPRKIVMLRDTKKECYLYFQNKAVRITKEKIELVSYKKLKGFIWKRQIIPRIIKIKPESEGEYKTFVWRISGEDKARYYTLKSVTGFLLHSYKHDAKNRVVVFNDQLISDYANGGSGKGIFHKAIGHMKNIEVIDGKSADMTNRFLYENVTYDTQVLFYDDIKKHFRVSQLFSIITEGIKVEEKGVKSIFIPFSDSPKITIATNYVLKGDGGSHNRRVFEVELSAHYNESFTPEDEFNHLLFKDWRKKEWRRFDNYMIRSVQLYLKKGLIKSKSVNLDERKVIGNTSEDFVNFMDSLDFREQQEFKKTALKDIFTKEFPELLKSKFFNSAVFNRWVGTYCKYEGLEFIKSKRGGGVLLIIGPYEKGAKPPKGKEKIVPTAEDDTPF